MKKFNELSFQSHIFLGFLIVALIPLLLSSFIMVKVYTVTLEHQMIDEGKQEIEHITNRLSSLFASQNEVCNVLLKQDWITLVLIDHNTVEYPKELYLTLYQLRDTIPTYTSFTIYDIGGHQRFSTDPDTAPAISPIYWGVLHKVRQSKSTIYHATDSILHPDKELVFETASSLQNSAGSKMGYVVMGVTKANLDSLLEGSYSSRDAVFITDSYFNLIYSSDSEYSEEVIMNLKNQTTDPSFYYTYAREPHSGFYVILQKHSAISNSTVRTMYRISWITGILCLGLCIMISLYLGHRLAYPISRLTQAMDKVKEGDLEVSVVSNRKDELGKLTDNFNHMTRDLKGYVERLMQRQKDLNDTKLRLFQTQLNPHFLYNTLDSIKWSAKIHQIDEIACMAENLAVILRKSISGKQFITLKQELETVNNYVSIQKIRFSDKFTYEAEIPDQLENCIVPKLLLQPIVENAIIHGLANRDSGEIIVYADQVGSNIHICVTDDGCGMSQDIMDWLNSGNVTKIEGHFGLYNLNNIIKIYYGSEYGLTATVEQGIGTTVTAILPIRKEIENDSSGGC
mgnify:CR=1 FL=1